MDTPTDAELLDRILRRDGRSATQVIKTENRKKGEPRWLTITWARSKAGDWKITHWYTLR